VLEIGHIPEVWKEVTHDADDGLGAAGAFLPVFKGEGMIDHALDVTPVFGQSQVFQLRIVIEFVDVHVKLIELVMGNQVFLDRGHEVLDVIGFKISHIGKTAFHECLFGQ